MAIIFLSDSDLFNLLINQNNYKALKNINNYKLVGKIYYIYPTNDNEIFISQDKIYANMNFDGNIYYNSIKNVVENCKYLFDNNCNIIFTKEFIMFDKINFIKKSNQMIKALNEIIIT